jgi:peroxiredoxin
MLKRALLSGICLFLVAGAFSAPGKAPCVGDPAPLFVLRDDGGAMVSLNLLCGDKVPEARRKVIVLDFFQVKCKPCIEELPQITKFHEMWKNDKRVQFFMIGVGETTERIEKFRLEHGCNLPILIDPYLVTGRGFGIETFPMAMIIDKNGVIRLIVKDKQPNIDEILSQNLKKILGG